MELRNLNDLFLRTISDLLLLSLCKVYSHGSVKLSPGRSGSKWPARTKWIGSKLHLQLFGHLQLGCDNVDSAMWRTVWISLTEALATKIAHRVTPARCTGLIFSPPALSMSHCVPSYRLLGSLTITVGADFWCLDCPRLGSGSAHAHSEQIRTGGAVLVGAGNGIWTPLLKIRGLYLNDLTHLETVTALVARDSSPMMSYDVL